MRQKNTPDTPPTDRQTEVLRAILSHYAEHGGPPSIREVGVALGITSTNGVVVHLRALESKGLILRLSGSARGVRVKELDEALKAAASECLRKQTITTDSRVS